MNNKRVSNGETKSEIFETKNETDKNETDVELGKDLSLDIFPNEEVIPDGPEISLSDYTISLLDHEDNKYKTVKEIILEEELRKKDDKIYKLRHQKLETDNNASDKESVLNPDIEKITDDDPDERKVSENRENKILNNSRNRNQMFL